LEKKNHTPLVYINLKLENYSKGSRNFEDSQPAKAARNCKNNMYITSTAQECLKDLNQYTFILCRILL